MEGDERTGGQRDRDFYVCLGVCAWCAYLVFKLKYDAGGANFILPVLTLTLHLPYLEYCITEPWSHFMEICRCQIQ